MPIGDSNEFPKEHYSRVYKHIFRPACEKAGFSPLRADEVSSTNHIVLDVLKNIIDSDLVLCDLSSQNPNVLYELGIRQAFNRPVCLVKDRLTARIFDIQGLRDYEYDETLRIDNVNRDIEHIADSLNSTYEGKDSAVNSLVSLLSLTPAELADNQNLSAESTLILQALEGFKSQLTVMERTIKRPVQKFGQIFDDVSERLLPEEIESLKVGEKVVHNRFGLGEIVTLTGDKYSTMKADINFEGYGKKSLILKFAFLSKVGGSE